MNEAFVANDCWNAVVRIGRESWEGFDTLAMLVIFLSGDNDSTDDGANEDE